MGKASRTKAERRKRVETSFGVFCPGMLEVLSIGKGDLKLTLDGKNPGDVERARQLIEEMLRKGYAIFVETDDGPVRATRFNPKRMTYLISEVVEEAGPKTFDCPACGRELKEPRYDLSSGTVPDHRRGAGRSPFCPQAGQALDAAAVEHEPPKRRKKERHVPVAGSRATAVGRTAGG